MGNFLWIALVVGFFLGEAQALVAIDSLLLGENIQEAETSVTDPLNYVFQSGKMEVKEQEKFQADKWQLREYYGLYREGKNLNQLCEKDIPISYETFDQREQVKMSMVATLQYIGLDLTTRALADYARFFEFDEEEFQNLLRRSIGNYCSENLTIISLRQLAKNMLDKFKRKDRNFHLPEFGLNTLFPENLDKATDPREAKKNEFLYTLKLFRAFCSWGGNVDDLRLLVPLVNNPFIMSFVIRQMSGQRITWNQRTDTTEVVTDNETVQVFCENMICRKTPPLEFRNKMPLSMGKISMSNDLKRLFCQDLKTTSYKFGGQEKRVKKWIEQQSLDEENLLVSQFLALLTGIPDLMVRMGSFDQLQELLRSSLDWEWGKWATEAGAHFSTDILYEESMTVEKIDRSFYFDRDSGKFQMVFDVNFGEIDRVHQGVGKLEVVYPLVFPLKFLRWIRTEWINRDHRRKLKNKRLKEILKIHVATQVKRAGKKFIIPPWKKGLEDLIASELLEQLESYTGNKFRSLKEEEVVVPVKFRYGLFALKYFHYRFRSLRGLPEIDL